MCQSLNYILFVTKSGLIYSTAENSVVQSILDLMVYDSVYVYITFCVVQDVTSKGHLTSWFTIGFLKLRFA